MALSTDKPYPPYPPTDVFFLGAGTSVSGGAPTFANFRNKAKDVRSKMLENGESNSTKISLFKDVLTQWDKDFSDYNIEEYYSAIEMNEHLDRGDESITTEKIAKFIALTIQESIDTPHTPSYELLAAYAVRKAIITTNWDILLERSIRESQGTDAFSYGNGIQPYGKTTQPQSSGSHRYVIPILKLHGSLNWGFCKKCGQTYCFGGKIYGRLVLNNGEKCEKCDHDVRLTPLIVPPTLSKLEGVERREEESPYVPLRSIWSEASKCLMSCEKVYFIGYSFPETDVQMKIFISNALRINENLKEVTIVSNPKYGNSRVDFEERYSPILLKIKNNSKTIFNYDGFEIFCEEKLRKVEGRYEVIA